MPQVVKLPDTTIGDAFGLAIQVTDPTQNFTTVTAASVVEQTTPPYTNPAFTFSPVISFPSGVTTFIVTLSMSGAQTTTLGLGQYMGDLKISMSGYGPYHVVAFQFNIVPAIT